MKKIVGLVFLSAALILPGCVKSCQPFTSQSSNSAAKENNDHQINLFIWGEYTSPEILKDFEAQSGIKVVESNFSSNEELLAKIQAGAEGYDLIVPSDYMVSVMIKLGLLAPLDKSKIPNAKYIEPSLLKKPYDPDNSWSLPYSWTVTGIVYNKSKLSPPITGYGDLFSREDLKQRVSFLDDNREVMAAVLKPKGHSANTTIDSELDEAKNTLLTLKRRIREFNSSPVSLLQNGDILAAQIYSNEALRLATKNPEFEFILPADGFTIAIDNMAIPKNSRHIAQVHMFINYLLGKEVNTKFATELLTAPVIKGVRELLPAQMKNYPAIGKIELIQSKGEMLHDLGETTQRYDRVWTEVKASAL